MEPNESVTLEVAAIQLSKEMKRIIGRLQEQTASPSKGYGLLHDSSGASHDAIEALLDEDFERVQGLADEMIRSHQRFYNFDLPWHDLYRFIRNSAQEIVEFFYVDMLWDYVFYGNDLRPLQSWSVLVPIPSGATDPVRMKPELIPPQSVLDGMIDTPSELRKMVGEIVFRNNLSAEDELAIHERLLKAMEFIRRGIQEVLRAGRLSGAMLDAMPRGPGHHESFSTKFRNRVERNIREEKERVVALRREVAKMKPATLPAREIGPAESMRLHSEEVRNATDR